jgi:hypothetical protein
MSATDDLLAWCRDERKKLELTLSHMESGKLRLYEGTNTDRDMTAGRMEEIRQTIAELDGILARHPGA